MIKFKSFKLDSNSSSEYFSKPITYGSKIKPMPLMSVKVEYKGHIRQIRKIPAKGYKYVSRVLASGEHTIEVLNKIKQTSNLKFVRSLEFDPYLCESSGLKSLSEVLVKLKRPLDSLTIIFRRFTVKDELKRLSLCLARLDHMKKIKVDFPNPKGIETQDLKDLQRNCRKFVSLKSAEVRLSGSKTSAKSLSRISGIFHNALNVEEVSSYLYLSQKEALSEQTKEKTSKTRFLKNVKSFFLKYAFKTDWTSYDDGADPRKDFHTFLRRFPSFTNPVRFSITFDKMLMHSEVIDALAVMLPQLTNLRFIYIELNNIKLSEFEMMTLAKGFVECKQIEHLTFKYLDNTIIPMMDLIQFIIIMAKFSPFPKLDLFFRKLFYPQWQTTDVKQKLDELGNIKYVLTKQSIHVQKIQCVENGE